MRPSPWRPRSGDVRGAGCLRPAEVRPRPRSRRRAPPTGCCGRCRRLHPCVSRARFAPARAPTAALVRGPLFSHPHETLGSKAVPKIPEVQRSWVLFGPYPTPPVMGYGSRGSQFRSEVLGLGASIRESTRWGQGTARQLPHPDVDRPFPERGRPLPGSVCSMAATHSGISGPPNFDYSCPV